jgi:CRP-like cAMP-binding protein
MPAEPAKVQTFLARLPMFRALAPEELDRIAHGTREIRAARGEVLFQRGDPCEGFHVIVYGQIKLAFNSPGGTEKVVDLLGPGQSFGEALMFMEQPYVVHAQALADSLLLYITKAVVFQEIARTPGFAHKMIAGLSRRLHGLIGDIESYTFASGAQRVIGYLLQAADEVESGAAVQVTLPARKNIIASRLNLTPEHFSRILHDLTKAGMIRVDRDQITIVDIAALRNYEG